MATYSSAYPSLPALASGHPDSPAPAIAADAPKKMVGDMNAASRQTKGRKVLHDANPPRCTNQELEDAMKRELCVHLEHATNAVAMPAWAADLQNNLQDMQNQMNDMQNNLQNQLNNMQNNLQNQLNIMQNQMNGMQNLLQNAATYQPYHPIFPIPDMAGNPPPDFFPATRLDLDHLPANQLAALLQFYGLPNAPVATRLDRLKQRLGIRP